MRWHRVKIWMYILYHSENMTVNILICHVFLFLKNNGKIISEHNKITADNILDFL